MTRKLQLLLTTLLLVAGVNGAWADDTSVTFNGITWERGNGILTFDDTNKVITGTTSNWGCIGIKTVSGTNIILEKDRLTWLVITGTNLDIGTNNPRVNDINGADPDIKCISSKSNTTQIVFDITKRLPEADGSGNVTISSLSFYLNDPNGVGGDHAITENQPTVTNIEIVYPETDSPIAPINELLFRTNSDNSAWNSGFPKEANSTNQDYEINYLNGFFALQKYTVENLAAVKSLTVHIFGDSSKGHDAMAIWALRTNDWSSSSDASTLTSTVSAVVGLAPHSSSGDANSPLINGTSNRYTADGVQHCLFVISGEALTTLKNSATDDTFTLLITNRTGDLKSNSQRKYYTSGNSIVPFRPYIEVTSTYPAAIGNTGYETLNAAFDGVETTGTIKLYDDITITSLCNVGAKNITVVAAKDGVSVSSTLSSSLWLLAGNAASNLTFGSDDHTITINGGNVSNSSNTVEAGNGTTTFKNVIFKDCVSTHNFGITCLKGTGKLYLDNVTFNGCTANDGWGIVFAGNNDLYLQNEITFIDCAAYNIYLENKFARVGDISTTLAKPLTVFYKTPSLGAVILSSANGGDKSSLFQLMNENYGIVKNSGHYTDHVLTEAYTTNITSAGAATLMLPFVSKIPTGVAAYTLNYTAGKTYVKATEVTGGTLSANTPVLLNAEAGKYWFINTTNVASATTDDGANHTVGALVGVYTDTYCPADDYLLGVKDEVVAFYHPAGENTNYIRANRAYLHADGAGARLTVNFDDEEETTGIENLTPALSKGEGAVFDLSGRRVAQPTKGLYIVNGKKVVIK